MMLRPVASPATVVEPPPPTIPVTKMTMPEPVDTVPTSYTPVTGTSAPSSFNRQPTPLSRPPVNNHHNYSDPTIVPPSYGAPASTVTPYPEHNQFNANTNYNDSSYPPHRESTPISLPLSTNDILQNVFTQQPTYQQQQAPPLNHTSQQMHAPVQPPTTMPLNKQQQQMSSTNPYFKNNNNSNRNQSHCFQTQSCL
ncbi:unnamed protein product [Mucor hiemalis]